MHMRMDARGAGPSAGQQPGEGIWSACDMHMRMDARSAAGEGIWSACDMRMRMDARGAGPPARQQPGEGIWSACDMHMRMDARGAGPPARQQLGEGIWSACDMHMRMDARGAGPPARQQLGEGIWSACDMRMRRMPVGRVHLQVSSRGRASRDARGAGPPPACMQPREGIWSACDMHMRMDARHLQVSSRGRASGVPCYARDNGCPCPEAVDTDHLHSRSTTSVATKIDLASRVPRASCPTLEESRRRRTAPALSAISSPHASLMATTPMSANTPPRAVSTDTTLISLHPPSSR